MGIASVPRGPLAACRSAASMSPGLWGSYGISVSGAMDTGLLWPGLVGAGNAVPDDAARQDGGRAGIGSSSSMLPGQIRVFSSSAPVDLPSVRGRPRQSASLSQKPREPSACLSRSVLTLSRVSSDQLC
jgi:hypothetical protein